METKKMTNSNPAPRPIIRAASVLIENGRILLIKQEVTATRHWALPGGKLDWGETLEQCLIREMKEETGLDIQVKELIYITDRIIESTHVVHMSFLVEKTDTGVLPTEWKHNDPFPSASSDRIREIRMVPIIELNTYGYPLKWCELVKTNFPGKGSYKGDFFTFYGE
jgi:ADP-ribose pyrophosphatase YjhB (NUDIX family)